MTVPVNVLTADVASLATIRTAVNITRLAATPPYSSLSAEETICGCIQVGLNGLVDRLDVPNTSTVLPLLSVIGEPGSTSNIEPDATLTARILAVYNTFEGPTIQQVRDLALHAGVLIMTGVATSAYRPSFDA